ncbi:MAG: Gfo/Idh/MocA family oxidoreductase [Gemmataceae bacterium]|nr:Gfo/Idh/MocA family oxidoreductase [Gemmataceae bacterium]MCI0740953.1 Gfo/Idh/MocA family oxidoreductase [Gemmataceae bacterium]
MPLRLGMLGMWHTHADGIVRQVAEHPKEFTLVGFYERDAQVVAERRKQWGPRLGNLRIVDKPEQLFEQQLDGVVVEGRVNENLRLARLALEQGKPIMLEKPAGDNLEDYRRLVDQAQRKHLHIQMIYLFRYMSAVQELLQRARKNEFGRVYHFRARLPKDLGSYKRFVEELAPYKGGMFFEMAGHVIDMMVAILGTPRQITPFLAHHHREGPAHYIDNGVAVFGYPNAWAIIEIPALEVAPHSRRLEVFGTEGALVIPHLGSGHLANKNVQPVEIYRAGQGDWQTIQLPARTLQISDLREFAAVVTGKKRPEFSMEHDLAVQETLLRASGMLPAKK